MHPVVRLSFICQQFIVRLLIFFTNHIFCHLINQCAPFYLYTSSSFIQSLLTSVHPSTLYIIVIHTIFINQCAPFYLYTSSSFIQYLLTSVHHSTCMHHRHSCNPINQCAPFYLYTLSSFI